MPALTPEEINLYYYYIGWFVILLILLIIFRRVSGIDRDSGKSAVVTVEFKQFQRRYVLVYLIMMSADWLQGPYVYALYTHYGYNIGEIGVLFIVGFGSSLVFGTIVGSAADRYGRKKLCIWFGIFYSLSCITKHFHNYQVLLLGRFLGGISTSILFSSFESWMVHEHHAANYPEEWLGMTFSVCTSGNGIVAIGSGVVASVVRDKFGPVAPFDVSLICLIVGSVLVARTWKENYGDFSSNLNLTSTLTHAFQRMRQDSKIAFLGIIQSFFEGAMYVFVFMWTPALESTTKSPIYHGWIFASFMISTLIGSGIFQFLLSNGYRVERFSLVMFTVAGASLLFPAFSTNHTFRLVSFLVFEVCVGMFWPSLGFMRSRYVPEEVRATTMNFFRIPLNLIVVIILYNIDNLAEHQVFATCFACLLPSLFCQWKLCEQVLNSPEVVKKSGENEDSVPLTAVASG